MAFPDIAIGSTFDAKGFKQAETASKKLGNSVKSLAKGFGLAFGTAAVVRFGKASVKAFAADDAAAKSLGQTLKNLGLAYGANTGTVNGFISRLEAQTGVLDDELRPAMDRLLRATGDVAKSQELLNLSLDIAAGTGKSVTQVSQSLQKAYLGQNQALGRLGVGLSKVELTSSSFEEIQIRLNELFAGQAVQAADSFQGSLNKLSVAANNAKETIGKGIIEALSGFSGKEGVGGAVSAIDKLANGISDTITGVGYLAQKVDYAKPILVGAGLAIMAAWGPWFTAITAAVAVVGYIGNKLKKAAGFQGMGNVSMTGGSNQDTQKYEASQKKIAAAKSKADKLAATNKIKADKAAAENAAKLSKAAALFDMDKIQIEAALKGKITDEESLRLRLQQAILNEDASTAEKLQKQLEASQRATATLTGQLYGIKPLEDPFAEWIKSLKEIGETLSKILGMPVNTSSSMLKPNQPIVAQQDPNSTIQPKTNVDPIPVVVIPDPTTTVMPTTNMPTPTSGGFGFTLPSYITSGQNFTGGAYTPPVTINVITEGNIYGVDQFDDVINQAFLNAQRKGLTQTPAGSLP